MPTTSEEVDPATCFVAISDAKETDQIRTEEIIRLEWSLDTQRAKHKTYKPSKSNYYRQRFKDKPELGDRWSIICFPNYKNHRQRYVKVMVSSDNLASDWIGQLDISMTCQRNGNHICYKTSAIGRWYKSASYGAVLTLTSEMADKVEIKCLIYACKVDIKSMIRPQPWLTLGNDNLWTFSVFWIVKSLAVARNAALGTTIYSTLLGIRKKNVLFCFSLKPQGDVLSREVTKLGMEPIIMPAGSHFSVTFSMQVNGDSIEQTVNSARKEIDVPILYNSLRSVQSPNDCLLIYAVVKLTLPVTEKEAKMRKSTRAVQKLLCLH